MTLVKKPWKAPAHSARDMKLKALILAAADLGWEIIMDTKDGGWDSKCRGMVLGEKAFLKQFTHDEGSLEVELDV